MNQVLRRERGKEEQTMTTKHAVTNDSTDTVAAQGAKSGKRAKKGAKAKPERESPRAGSKAGTILELIGRAKGATLDEIMAATGWQAHSVRGFLSTAAKKHQVKIESMKNENGGRVYRMKE
jgi:Protein of unknown function (DUF3489)